MLFLAVSLGFFVENQREHYIENHRSEQYAEFLYNDLINDTVNLVGRTAFMEKAVTSVDTLMTLLTSFKNDSASIARIYELSGYAYSGIFFSATTSTMQQLKKTQVASGISATKISFVSFLNMTPNSSASTQ